MCLFDSIFWTSKRWKTSSQLNYSYFQEIFFKTFSVQFLLKFNFLLNQFYFKELQYKLQNQPIFDIILEKINNLIMATETLAQIDTLEDSKPPETYSLTEPMPVTGHGLKRELVLKTPIHNERFQLAQKKTHAAQESLERAEQNLSYRQTRDHQGYQSWEQKQAIETVTQREQELATARDALADLETEIAAITVSPQGVMSINGQEITGRDIVLTHTGQECVAKAIGGHPNLPSVSGKNNEKLNITVSDPHGERTYQPDVYLKIARQDNTWTLDTHQIVYDTSSSTDQPPLISCEFREIEGAQVIDLGLPLTQADLLANFTSETLGRENGDAKAPPSSEKQPTAKVEKDIKQQLEDAGKTLRDALTNKFGGNGNKEPVDYNEAEEFLFIPDLLPSEARGLFGISSRGNPRNTGFRKERGIMYSGSSTGTAKISYEVNEIEGKILTETRDTISHTAHSQRGVVKVKMGKTEYESVFKLQRAGERYDLALSADKPEGLREILTVGTHAVKRS